MNAVSDDEGDGTGEPTDRADARDRSLQTTGLDDGRDVHGTGVSALFAGSDGNHYTDWQLERRLERGTWRHCLSQQEPERHVLEDERGRRLVLERLDLEHVPPWLEVRIGVERAWAVDTRGVVATPTVGTGSARSSRDGADRR